MTYTTFKLLSVLVCIIAIVAAQSSPDEVSSLPGIGVPKTRTLSGFLLANKTYGANLYYLFMESQNDPKNDPVVLWLQGGPGSTSMFGCFTEFGPYLMEANGTFTNNIYSWNTNASVLWIDQPVGTGYSYVENMKGYASTEEVISADLYNALVIFMQMHPEYSKLPFYAFGESYAGKYIPWLAYTIINNSPSPINLKGIGLGDGWVDPQWQAASYGPFLYLHQRITSKQFAKFNQTYQQYLTLVEKYKKDITDPSFDAMLKYMKRDDVKAALHATGRDFKEGGIAYRKLNKDEEQSCLFTFPTILQKVPVLLYNGEYDLICNWIGTAYYAEHIGWPGQSAFNAKKDTNWLLQIRVKFGQTCS